MSFFNTPIPDNNGSQDDLIMLEKADIFLQAGKENICYNNTDRSFLPK